MEYPKHILQKDAYNQWSPPLYSRELIQWYHQYYEISGVYLKKSQSLHRVLRGDEYLNPTRSSEPLEDYRPIEHLICFQTSSNGSTCDLPAIWWHPRHTALWCSKHAQNNTKRILTKMWFTDLYDINTSLLLRDFPQLKFSIPYLIQLWKEEPREQHS